MPIVILNQFEATNKLNLLREFETWEDQRREEKSLFLSLSIRRKNFPSVYAFEKRSKELVKLIDGVAHRKTIPFNSFENRFSISSAAI